MTTTTTTTDRIQAAVTNLCHRFPFIRESVLGYERYFEAASYRWIDSTDATYGRKEHAWSQGWIDDDPLDSWAASLTEKRESRTVSVDGNRIEILDSHDMETEVIEGVDDVPCRARLRTDLREQRHRARRDPGG